MILRALAACGLISVLLGGCVVLREAPEAPPRRTVPVTPVEPGRYEPTPGHAAESVVELRATPAPQLPEATPGTAIQPDERKLVAKSYVRIGTGVYPTNDDAARAWALRTGQRVSADKILFYAPSTDPNDNADAPFVAVFYVRYKLPFGAKFSDLSKDEMQKLGIAGGVEIESVYGGTPASEANLRKGDFVLKFNGAPIRNHVAFQDLLRANMGKHVTLTVSRDGELFDRLVRLGVLATESHDVEK